MTFCMNILPMPGVLRVELNDLERIVLIFPGFLEKCSNGDVRAIGSFTSFSSTEKISKGQDKMLWDWFLVPQVGFKSSEGSFIALYNYPTQEGTDSGQSLVKDAKIKARTERSVFLINTHKSFIPRRMLYFPKDF